MRKKMEAGPALKKFMAKYDEDGEMHKSMKNEEEEPDEHEEGESMEDEEVEEEALKKFKAKKRGM